MPAPGIHVAEMAQVQSYPYVAWPEVWYCACMSGEGSGRQSIERRGRAAAVRIAAAIILLLPIPGAAAAADASPRSRLDRLEIDVVRAEDARTLRKLQHAYGYYADRGLWEDLADLFADDAIANYPSGGFDGKASIRAMFVENLGQGRLGLAEGRIYNHIILQPVIDLAPDGASATGRWRVLGMLGRFGGSATWADSLYRFDYVKQDGRWKIKALTAYAGSGGGYEQGWVQPRPRPPGAADTSPVRFNLAHPADRPWVDPCEADVSACVVPFPYPNRGGIRAPAQVSAVIAQHDQVPAAARAADLIRRAQRLEDEQAVLNLQNAYGYFVDRGLWNQAAGLFAPDGTREQGQSGVYVGRERIRQSLAQSAPQGLRAGQLNDHLQLEPVITVSADGRSAKGRIFELAFVGGGGQPARIVQNVHENDYVRRDGTWMIRAMHSYTILDTDYAQGWAKSAHPAAPASAVLPPDRPPTVAYETYPKVFTPPLHFANVATGGTTRYPAGVAVSPAVADGSLPSTAADTGNPDARIAAAERQAKLAADFDEVANLQNAYGYYAEKSLWQDIAALFVDRGVLEIDGVRHIGQERILRHLRQSGPDGPVRGALASQLHLQPVIHVAPDGRTARIRSRVLRLARDAQGRPAWGAAIHENELVKEDGTWKFHRMRVYRTYEVSYAAGWAAAQQAEGELLPSTRTPPFHYRDPVSGR